MWLRTCKTTHLGGEVKWKDDARKKENRVQRKLWFWNNSKTLAWKAGIFRTDLSTWKTVWILWCKRIPPVPRGNNRNSSPLKVFNRINDGKIIFSIGYPCKTFPPTCFLPRIPLSRPFTEPCCSLIFSRWHIVENTSSLVVKGPKNNKPKNKFPGWEVETISCKYNDSFFNWHNLIHNNWQKCESRVGH